MTGRENVTHDEDARVAALGVFNVAHPGEDPVFDKITRLAAEALGVPIALISFIDRDRVWLKSHLDFAEKVLPRSTILTGSALVSEDIFVIEDATAHAQFQNSSLVVGPPHIRYLAAASLVTQEGFRIGALVAIDRRARVHKWNDTRILLDLAGIVMDELELKAAVRREQEARRRADEANRAKSAFLSRMSHEIRTPLAGIIGLADVLTLNEGAKEAQHASDIRSAAKDLLQIVDDLLDLSRLEAGRLRIERKDFDLAEMLRHLDHLFRPQAERKGLNLKISIGADGGRAAASGDPLRIRQVLFNLVSNAIKFTQTGGVTVALHLERKGRIVLHGRVEDTGLGIAQENQKRIFEPFEQVDTSQTRNYQGTGLGLAIVKELLELMGGSIALDSQEGRGTRIDFEVPLEEASTAGAQSTPDDDGVAPGRPLAGLDVLVVEDNAIIRTVITAVLQSWGASATAVSSGHEALAVLALQDYDLAIIDIHMPSMDGRDLARAVRGRQGGESLPILALTADARPESRAECLRAGIDCVETKPIVWSKLLSGILKARMGRAAQPAAAAGAQ